MLFADNAFAFLGPVAARAHENGLCRSEVEACWELQKKLMEPGSWFEFALRSECRRINVAFPPWHNAALQQLIPRVLQP